jgi:hypothetical protein
MTEPAETRMEVEPGPGTPAYRVWREGKGVTVQEFLGAVPTRGWAFPAEWLENGKMLRRDDTWPTGEGMPQEAIAAAGGF